MKTMSFEVMFLLSLELHMIKVVNTGRSAINTSDMEVNFGGRGVHDHRGFLKYLPYLEIPVLVSSPPHLKLASCIFPQLTTLNIMV